jgi:hypothetical protein
LMVRYEPRTAQWIPVSAAGGFPLKAAR